MLQNKCHWQLLICYILYHVICHNLPIFFCNNKFDDSRELSLLNGKQQQQYLPNLRQRSFHYRIKKVLFVPPISFGFKGLHFLIDPYLVCDPKTVYYGRCNNIKVHGHGGLNYKVVAGMMYITIVWKKKNWYSTCVILGSSTLVLGQLPSSLFFGGPCSEQWKWKGLIVDMSIIFFKSDLLCIRMVSSPEFCEKRHTGGQVCQKIEKKKKEDPVARWCQEVKRLDMGTIICGTFLVALFRRGLRAACTSTQWPPSSSSLAYYEHVISK